MQSFAIFYYLNGRFPHANGLLWVPDSDKPNFISREKICSKTLYELFRGTHSHGLVLIQLLALINLFLGGKEKILKNALAEVYHNLSLKALSVKEIGITLEFKKITEQMTEINLRLQNLIFAKS